MQSLFENPSAFAPLFDDLVAVEGARQDGRRIAGTFRACVLDQGLDDLLSDGSTGTVRRRVVVTFRIGGDSWPADGTRPQSGDEITVADGAVYRVDRVTRPMGDMYECEARACR